MKIWPFMPQVGPTESLEWLTDLIETKGGDQRLSLRSHPRVAMQYNYLMDPSQFSRAKALAKALGSYELLVPVWTELTSLGSLTLGEDTLSVDTTLFRYQAGDQVLVWQDDNTFEGVEIESVTSTEIFLVSGVQRSYSNCLVCPLLVGMIASPLSVTRSNRDEVRSSMTFRFIYPLSYAEADSGLMYKGYEVVTERSHLISSIREVYEREISLVDYQLGQMTPIRDRTAPVQTTVLSWNLLSRSELHTLRRWLYKQAGKFGSFWIPSWNQDLQLVSDIASANTTITIQKRNYSDVLGEMDLIIMTSSETYLLHVDSWSVVGLNEVGVLESAAGFNLDKDDVEYIGWVTLMRFNSDRVEIKYGNAQSCTLSVPTKEVLGL